MHLDFLEEGGGLGHAVLGPAPAHHEGVLAHEVLPQPGETDGDDVLLEDHVPGQADQGHVVPEVRGTVERVDVLGLYLEVFVRESLRLLPDVPLAEPHLHAVGLGAEEEMDERGQSLESLTCRHSELPSGPISH